MPTGKVKWFDAEKGFGFVSGDEGGDVFLHVNALPDGLTTIKPGTRVEYSVADGRRGPQAMSVTLPDPPPSVVANKRRPAEEMVPVLEDVIKLLDKASESLRRGKYPDKKSSAQIAQVLRAVADQMDV